MIQSFLILFCVFRIITFIYNLPSITNLNLTLDTVSDIYMGKITKWNDTKLQSINLGIQLPSDNIIVAVNKLDATSDSYIMTSRFSAMYPEWKQKRGTVVDKWPGDNFAVSDQNYDTFIVNVTPYSIGYTSLATHKQFTSFIRETFNSTTAQIINNNGEVISNTKETVLSLVERLFRKTYMNETTYQNETKNPLIFFHYILYNSTTSPDVSCCAMQEATGLAEYILTGNSSTVEKFGYFPLPKVAVDYVINNLLPLITCNGTSTYAKYKSYKIRADEKQVENWKTTVLIASGLLLLLVIVIVGFIVYHKQVKRAKETLWLINFTDVQVHVDRSRVNNSLDSHPSDRSTAQGHPSKKFNCDNAVWKSKDSQVFITPIKLSKVSNWKRKTKLLITRFTQEFSQPNLDLLLGITVVQRQPYLVSQYCSKGTLNYFLTTCSYDLNVEVKYCFARDVYNGLKYLHYKNIVHGNLNSINCYVDGTWNVKISAWAMHSILESEEQPYCQQLFHNFDKKTSESSLDDTNLLITVLYMDAETVQAKKPSKPSDVYSYGMLLIEIFTRNLPFSDEVELCFTSYPDIVLNKVNNISNEPNVNSYDVPLEIKRVIIKLIGRKENRPEISLIANDVEKFRTKSNKSIVDVMMQTVEKYVEDLEDKIVERTNELTQVNARMKDLLCDIMPPQIAKKFINGQTPEPEFYESVSIFFSDVVGFTTISANSTPVEIIILLNELWKIIDKTLDKFDVYKIDTIGDAYMVASGTVTGTLREMKFIKDEVALIADMFEISFFII